MKILFVTYRFGKDIIGGAESYLWNLSTHLAGLGADVTVATTTASGFYSPTRWNVFWEKGYAPGEEKIDGLRILRFPFSNLPKWRGALYGIPLQKRFEEEEWMYPPPFEYAGTGGVPLRGWHFEERSGNSIQRWTGKKAEIFIRDQHIWEVNFTAMSPWENRGEVFVNDNRIGEFDLNRHPEFYSFKLNEPRDTASVRISLKRTKRPWRDLRHLGMAVTTLGYNAGDHTRIIPLSRHYQNIMIENTPTLLDWMEKRAHSRPGYLEGFFDRCRGPNSRGLRRYIRQHAGEYDIITGHDFPHRQLAETVNVAKKAGIPSAAIPLAHLEDEYYHWTHYYNALKNADLTLALSGFSQDIFREQYGANAHSIGAGIVPEEFESPDISGARFRETHNMGTTPIILFIGRKSYPKRYEELVRAVKIVNEKKSCRLVMIGPDENLQPVSPEDALYLGRLPRPEMLNALDACDVFAMLSGSESFGMVFLEAWMMRKPVIGNRRCGAVASLISHGEDGFLCDSAEDTAERIIQLFNNPTMRKEMGKKGQIKTMENFTWDKIARRVYDLFEDLTRGSFPNK